MIKFEYWDGKEPEFTSENMDKLWEQGVNLDDFDYMLFFENDSLKMQEPSRFFRYEIVPDDYRIEALLRGCCSNKWYPVNDFMGRKGILGVAYHA